MANYTILDMDITGRPFVVRTLDADSQRDVWDILSPEMTMRRYARALRVVETGGHELEMIHRERGWGNPNHPVPVYHEEGSSLWWAKYAEPVEYPAVAVVAAPAEQE